jgi:hypothetical protein
MKNIEIGSKRLRNVEEEKEDKEKKGTVEKQPAE